MAKKLEKLVAKHLLKLPPAMHNDGAGLYLLVRASGSRVWIFRYRDRVTGKLRDKGLGPLDAITLAQARVEASKLRAALQTGVDPIQSHREAVQAARVKRAKDKDLWRLLRGLYQGAPARLAQCQARAAMAQHAGHLRRRPAAAARQ